MPIKLWGLSPPWWRLVESIKGVSSDITYHELGWETLEERRTKHTLILFNKIVHGKFPAYLSVLLPNHVQQQKSYKNLIAKIKAYNRVKTNKDSPELKEYARHLKNLIVHVLTSTHFITRDHCKSLRDPSFHASVHTAWCPKGPLSLAPHL